MKSFRAIIKQWTTQNYNRCALGQQSWMYWHFDEPFTIGNARCNCHVQIERIISTKLTHGYVVALCENCTLNWIFRCLCRIEAIICHQKHSQTCMCQITMSCLLCTRYKNSKILLFIYPIQCTLPSSHNDYYWYNTPSNLCLYAHLYN